MDLAALTNAPREVTLAGRTFTVSALKLREWGAVQQWVKDNAPSPMESVEAAAIDKLSPYAARMLLSVAVKEQQAWPPRVASSEWFHALDRIGKDGRNGNAVFLLAVLGKHQKLTEAEAEALIEQVTAAETTRLVAAALGFDDPAPKAPAGPDPATG